MKYSSISRNFIIGCQNINHKLLFSSKGLSEKCNLSHRSLLALLRQRSVRGKKINAIPIVAYVQSDHISDWRIKKMSEICHIYFSDLWSKGNVEVVDEILDTDFVHQDNIWRKNKALVVGRNEMKKFVTGFKKSYPDMYVEIVEFAPSDMSTLFVHWEGWATNLGKFHGKEPTCHYTKIDGINIFKFNEDKTQITKVSVWRSALGEERQLEAKEGLDIFDVHLAKLHYE